MREPLQLELFPEPAPEPDRSVISIRTRDVWMPPELETASIETVFEGPVIDTEAAKICRFVLEDLEAGKVEGLCLLTWSKESGRFQYVVTLPHALKRQDPLAVSEMAFKWAGGLDFLKANVIDVAVIAGDYEPGMIVDDEMGQE